MSHTYYQILNLEPNACFGDIRKSYLNLCKEYHPDKLPDNVSDGAKRLISEQMILINEAYEVLKDDESRNLYDKKLRKIKNQDLNSYRGEEAYSGSSSPQEQSTNDIENLFSNEIIAIGKEEINAKQNKILSDIEKDFSDLEKKYKKRLGRIKNHKPRDFDVIKSSSKLESNILYLLGTFIILFFAPFGSGLSILLIFIILILSIKILNNFNSNIYPAEYINEVKTLLSKKESALNNFKSECLQRVNHFKSIPINSINHNFVYQLSSIDRVFLLQALKERADTEQAEQFIKSTVKTVAVVGLLAIFLASVS